MSADHADDEHIRYMLDGGTRGLLGGLVETRDAWGFGGTLWISKQHAQYKSGPGDSPVGRFFELRPETRFYKQWFELDTGARGWAIWFQAPELPLRGRSLCGWVQPEWEHEATAWIAFLNAEISKRVKDGKTINVDSDDAKRDRNFEQSVSLIRSLGAHVPEATNIEELVTGLEESSKDGPIDLRSTAATSATEASVDDSISLAAAERTSSRGGTTTSSDWLTAKLGSAYGPNGWIGADTIRISADGRIELENQRGERRRGVSARLTGDGSDRLRNSVIESVFDNPPPLQLVPPDSTFVELTLTSPAAGPRTVVIEYYRGLAHPELSPLVKLIDTIATYLRDPRNRGGGSDIIEIIGEDAEWS